MKLWLWSTWASTWSRIVPDVYRWYPNTPSALLSCLRKLVCELVAYVRCRHMKSIQWKLTIWQMKGILHHMWLEFYWLMIQRSVGNQPRLEILAYCVIIKNEPEKLSYGDLSPRELRWIRLNKSLACALGSGNKWLGRKEVNRLVRE